MFRHTNNGAVTALALLLSGLLSGTAQAAAAADLSDIRKQIETLNERRAEDAQHIKDLEDRLAKTEAAANAAQQQSRQAVAAAAAAPPSSINSFNPGISLVLDGKLGVFQRDPETYSLAGFPLGGGGPGQRGLFLGEAEVTTFANVDDLFAGTMTMSLGQDGGETAVELEEAFIQTLALPGGFQATAGKMLSDVGYLNTFHAHADDFADRPLAYRAFLGDGFKETGLRLSWVAPMTMYLRAGGEVFRGESFPAAGARNRGFGARTAYLRVGDDFGTEISYQTGVSWLWADAANRETGNTPDSFTGKSDTGIAHLVVKWAPNGNPAQRNFKFQAEVLRNHISGVFNGFAVARTDYGVYGQAIYQFMRQWRVGYRYDWLSAGAIPAALSGSTLDDGGHKPTRHSAMLEYDHSEFSRLRVQYSYDRSPAAGHDHQILLQYTATLGAHPVHSY